MDFQLATEEQRANTVKDFLDTIKNYTKKNLIKSAQATMRDFFCYNIEHPSKLDRKSLRIGQGFQYKSRVILFTDFFVFITNWTHDPQKRKSISIKESLKAFTLGTIGAYVGDLTFGISEVFTMAGSKFLSSRNLLGKEPIPLLMNPWTQIIPLREITKCELIEFGKWGLGDALQINANLKYEGEKELFFRIALENKKWAKETDKALNQLELSQ